MREDFDLESLIPGSYEGVLAEPLAMDDLGQPKFELVSQRTRVMGILDLGAEGAEPQETAAPGSGEEGGSAAEGQQR